MSKYLRCALPFTDKCPHRCAGRGRRLRDNLLNGGIFLCCGPFLVCFGDSLAYFGLLLLYFDDSLAYFSDSLAYFNGSLVYFGDSLDYFNGSLTYFGDSLDYFGHSLRCPVSLPVFGFRGWMGAVFDLV
jgi:hypothetical protein